MQQALTQLQSLGSARSAHNKQASKQLLHAVLSANPKHWRSFFDECQSIEAASTQLLSAIQPHLQLPHPYDSVTATCMAFQILERLMQHLAAQQQQQQKQQQFAGAQHKVKQEQLQAADGPDEQQSRDTNTTAAPAQHPAGNHSPQQLQLLCQLHACAGLCWQAIVAKPSDLGLARHVLQYHAAAQSCLVLIHAYCRTAGLQQQLQELLVSLLLHGTMLALCPADPAAGPTQAAAKGLVLVKQEPSSQTSNAPDQTRTQDLQHLQQQLMLKASPAHPKQPTVPLLASLKALMRSSKAHAAAAKAAQRAANTSTSTPQSAASAGSKGAMRSPAPGAAAAASPAGPLQVAVSAAGAARAEELSMSGIKAWGLIAAELGPKLLDKGVGQPMLDVSMDVLAAGSLLAD